MPTRNRVRSGTAAAWTAANTVLKSGEVGFETDTRKLKIGDGATVWTSLIYFEAGAGGVADGDRGDITVSATGATWTIDPSVVSFSKIQSIGTDKLLGRDTNGTGAVEEVALSGGVEFTGSGGIRRSALTGDVVAPAGSNTTSISNGTITVSKMAPMSANSIMGNNTGGSATAGYLSAGAVAAMLPTFTDSTKGLVPAGGGGLATTTFTGAGWVSAPGAEPGMQQKTGIIAYFYPDTLGYWAQFKTYGSLVRLAIMNPSSGPGYGSSFNSGGGTHTAYAAQITDTQAAGIPVIHYLSQNYFDLKGESSINNWKGTVGVLEQFTAATSDVITTTTSHGFTTGMGPFQVKAWKLAENTLPGGLAPSTNYWWRTISSTTGTFHTTKAGAEANTGIVDVTSTGTGSGFYLGLSKTLANIQNIYDEIDLCLTRYPALSGFFLDEMNNDGGTALTSVQLIYDYIKAKPGNLLVVQNPGAGMPETYVNYADIFMSFEGGYASYTSWSPDAWMAKYPAEKFWHAVTNAANAAEAQAVVDLSRDRNAGTVSCNSGSFSNLPSYFADTMTAIQAGNAELVVSSDDSYGCIFFDQNPSSETQNVANTWIKTKGWTTDNTLADFVHAVDGRLTYAGDTPKTFRVTAGLSYTKVSGTASTIKWGLRKNGVEVAFMERWATVAATSADYHNIELQAIYTLSSSDYVEVWCQTSTGDNLIIQRGQIVATEV